MSLKNKSKKARADFYLRERLKTLEKLARIDKRLGAIIKEFEEECKNDNKAS